MRTIVKLGSIKLPKTLTPGDPPEFDWVPLKHLFVDETYQRDMGVGGAANVQRIIEEFRWSRFSPIIVTKRNADQYAIIDGQHRATAAHTLGLPRVPCFIIKCDRTEEAKAFASINGNVTNLSGLAIYHAELAARDRKAMALDAVCRLAGVIVPKKSGPLKPGVTLAIRSLKRALATHGAQVLEQALVIVTKTGNGNPGMLREGVIAGGCDVFAARPDWRGPPVLKKVSAAGGIPALYQQALELAATPKFNMRTAYAHALTSCLAGHSTMKVREIFGVSKHPMTVAEGVIEEEDDFVPKPKPVAVPLIKSKLTPEQQAEQARIAEHFRRAK